MYVMFKAGWQRMTYFGNDIYIHNFLLPPNKKQLKSVIDFAIENNFQRIIRDNEDDERVLWRSDYD